MILAILDIIIKGCIIINFFYDTLFRVNLQVHELEKKGSGKA